MRNVLLLVIDALTAPYLYDEIENGRLPTFAAIKENSVYRSQCTTVFPSITQAALSSLVTGRYPAEHGVLGSHWYREESGESVHFSTELSYIFQKGLGNHLYDLVYKLNHVYLNKDVSTIFEEVDALGMDAASINHLIYRGSYEHEVDMPFLFKFLPNLPKKITLKGPQQFMLGDFLNDPDGMEAKATRTGLLNWLGFHDNNAVDILNQLADSDAFPPFTLAYFPANDELSHRNGPVDAHRDLASLDKELGSFFERYGGVASFLERFTLIVTGDHSQTSILDDETESSIDLEQTLGRFRISETGMGWSDGDELMICTNMRAAQFYFRSFNNEVFETTIQDLLDEPRIDQVIWRAELTEQHPGYVCQSENGRLHFWRGTAESTATARDRYDNRWSWQGDLAVLDGTVQNGVVSFEDYPNAFERIAGILDSPESGPLWCTARLGYEFYASKVERHAGGGSHGSLHLSDTHAPLFVAGAPSGFSLPQHPRLIDVAPLCLQILQQETT